MRLWKENHQSKCARGKISTIEQPRCHWKECANGYKRVNGKCTYVKKSKKKIGRPKKSLTKRKSPTKKPRSVKKQKSPAKKVVKKVLKKIEIQDEEKKCVGGMCKINKPQTNERQQQYYNFLENCYREKVPLYDDDRQVKFVCESEWRKNNPIILNGKTRQQFIQECMAGSKLNKVQATKDCVAKWEKLTTNMI